MDSDLWPLAALVAAVLIAVLAVAVALAVRLVRTRRMLRSAGLPTGRRWVFWAALVYLVLPTDLLPDPVYLDDVGVLLVALRALTATPMPRPRRNGGGVLRTPRSGPSPTPRRW
ncbi:YkvA family protein [Streptomyces sp. NRRL F-5126]|uniref:YkvA family protein n=1 Tax=Streptomyces sp. NRRL F-5126 TaxID=1463857 RepID=UPI0004CBC8B0|nr:YkvA family protein [Streptomyces sp. NRRL F-5126]